jgi:dTDP-4-amino-4,6-dideoxygalactose transaminase
MKRYIGEEELIELKKVIDSQKLWKRDGSFVRKFEAAFSEKMGVKYAIGVNSGSSGQQATPERRLNVFFQRFGLIQYVL